MTLRSANDGHREGGSERGAVRRADALRNQHAIIDAALHVLAERPGASMVEIAEASGLGRATLYRHFRTRTELVDAIQQQALETASAAVAACRLCDVPPLRGLECAVRALVGVGDRYRILANEASLDPGMLEHQQAVAQPLLAAIRRGQQTGALRADLPAPWVLASMANLLTLALREIGAGRIPPDQAASMVVVTLLGGVASPGATVKGIRA